MLLVSTRTVFISTSSSFCTPTERYYSSTEICPFRQLNTIHPELMYTDSPPVESCFIHRAPIIPVVPRKALSASMTDCSLQWLNSPRIPQAKPFLCGIHDRLLLLVISIFHPPAAQYDSSQIYAHRCNSYAQSLLLTLTLNYTSTSYRTHTPAHNFTAIAVVCSLNDPPRHLWQLLWFHLYHMPLWHMRNHASIRQYLNFFFDYLLCI